MESRREDYEPLQKAASQLLKRMLTSRERTAAIVPELEKAGFGFVKLENSY